MTIAWPESFPDATIAGYNLRPDESIARTQMESGVARQRRRFTQAPTQVNVHWIMSQSIFSLFESWYVFKAKAGAEWINVPLSNGQGSTTNQVRFIEPYSAEPFSHDLWRVNALFEVREMAILDEFQLDLSLVPGSGAEWLILSGRLNAFVHTDLPNDDW